MQYTDSSVTHTLGGNYFSGPQVFACVNSGWQNIYLWVIIKLNGNNPYIVVAAGLNPESVLNQDDYYNYMQILRHKDFGAYLYK